MADWAHVIYLHFFPMSLKFLFINIYWARKQEKDPVSDYKVSRNITGKIIYILFVCVIIHTQLCIWWNLSKLYGLYWCQFFGFDIEGDQNMPSQNMSFWQIDYFEVKALEKKQMNEGHSDFSLSA